MILKAGILLLTLADVWGFYLPGIAPIDHKRNDTIQIYANRLFSIQTQLPFDYSYLNFCPSKASSSSTFSQALSGESLTLTDYRIRTQQPQRCVTLCTRENSEEDIAHFRWMIEKQYRVTWMVDGLPVGLRETADNVKASYYTDGFPVGFLEDEEVYINNHLHIVLQMYQAHNNTGAGDDVPDTWYVVGALVNPISLSPSPDGSAGCNSLAFTSFFNQSQRINDTSHKGDEEIHDVHRRINSWMKLSNTTMYTYSVVFERSEVKWASRWDFYMYLGRDSDVHWLSIINSFAMVLFLSALVAHILGRSLRRDIRTYNEQSDTDLSDETGWKQLHGEVFRPPSHPNFFSVVVGSGVQLLCVANVTLSLSCFGLLFPEHRGWLLTSVLFGYALVGSVAGFAATRLYISFGGTHWKKNAAAVALFYPGVAFAVFFVVNLCIWAEGSSGALPFLYLLYLLFIWLGISAPLVYVGCKVAAAKGPITYPCKTARIPRPLQLMPDMLKLRGISVLAGSLPFGCMYLELSYVMQSLWHHTMFYYLFGFLMLCFVVLMVTSAEVSMLMTYILLCKEDPRWWWYSFSVSGASGLYFFLYSVVYFFSELSMTRLSSLVLYFGYMLLGGFTYALLTGTAGFGATFFFVKTIYGMIKVS